MDLAAYLHLSGMDPDDIEFFDARGGRPTRMFCYRDSEMLRDLVRAFDRGAMVPARAFAEARAEMKRATGSRRAPENTRAALDDARDQVERR